MGHSMSGSQQPGMPAPSPTQPSSSQPRPMQLGMSQQRAGLGGAPSRQGSQPDFSFLGSYPQARHCIGLHQQRIGRVCRVPGKQLCCPILLTPRS